MKRRINTVAWILFGILAISAALISAGKRDELADPRTDSNGPSGLSAFAELLRRDGYQVTSTTSSVPILEPHDVVIAPFNEDDPGDLEGDSTTIYAHLADFVKKGGRMILLPLNPHFTQSSMSVHSAGVVHVATQSNYTLSLRQDFSELSSKRVLPDNSPVAALWKLSESGEEVAAIAKLQRGLVLLTGDGYMALNRFVDRDSNADALINIVRTVAPKGSRLVFAEAAYGAETPSLIEILGPGAVGAWYQGVFLFLVVVFTLGKRFGLPEERRPAQTGQRELVNAIADAYRRSKSTRVACRSAYDRADQEIRKALRLSSDAPASERDLRIPPALSLEFKRVFEASIDSLPAQEAFQRCSALQRQVKAFLHKG